MEFAASRMEAAQAAIMAGERSRVVEWRRVRREASWVGEMRALKMWEKARETSVGGMLVWMWAGEERRWRRGVIEMMEGGEAILEVVGGIVECLLGGTSVGEKSCKVLGGELTVEDDSCSRDEECGRILRARPLREEGKLAG
jgi:hypothetical protein